MSTQIDLETLEQATALFRGYADHQMDIMDSITNGGFLALAKSLFTKEWGIAYQRADRALKRWDWIIDRMREAA